MTPEQRVERAREWITKHKEEVIKMGKLATNEGKLTHEEFIVSHLMGSRLTPYETFLVPANIAQPEEVKEIVKHAVSAIREIAKKRPEISQKVDLEKQMKELWENTSLSQEALSDFDPFENEE